MQKMDSKNVSPWDADQPYFSTDCRLKRRVLVTYPETNTASLFTRSRPKYVTR